VSDSVPVPCWFPVELFMTECDPLCEYIIMLSSSSFLPPPLPTPTSFPPPSLPSQEEEHRRLQEERKRREEEARREAEEARREAEEEARQKAARSVT